MRLYTCFSPSHGFLAESLLASSNGKFDIVVEQLPKYLSDSLLQEDRHKVLIRKFECVLKAIEQNLGNSFLFADADVQLFGEDPAKELLNMAAGAHLAGQKDKETAICSGVMVISASDKTKHLFEELLRALYSHKVNQTALNYVLSRQTEVVSVLFDSRAYTVGIPLNWNLWKGPISDLEKILIPRNIVAFHANWIMGVERKLAALELIKWRVKNGYFDPMD